MRVKVLALCLILALSAAPMARATFATTNVVVPVSGQVEGTAGPLFSATVSITNPSTTGGVTYQIVLLKAGVNEPVPPAITDTLAPGATRVYPNIGVTEFGLSGTDRAAVRVLAPIELLVSSTLTAPVSTEPVLSTTGLLYAAVPDAFAISSGETATLREVQLLQDVRYHLLASETAGVTTVVHVRVKNELSNVVGESLITLQKFEQRLIPLRSIIGPLNVSDGSIEVTIEQGSGKVLVAGSLVTDQVQPTTGFDLAASSGSLTGVFAGTGLTGGGTSGDVTLSVADGGITAPKLANATVVRNINGKTDNVVISAGSNISILNNANGLTISASGTPGPQGPAGPAGPAGPQGPKGLNFRGTWNPATSYVADDSVTFDGSSFIAIAANVNQQPDTSVSWSALALGGEDAGTATSANVPGTIVQRDASGNFAAGTITANLSGNATNFTGLLAGDVTGAQNATVVKRVGGVLANAIASTVFTVNDGTSVNVPKTIVVRDSDASFDTETIRVGNGSTDTPSVSFIADPRSGMFLKNAGTVVFSANTAERLVLASTGTRVIGNLLLDASTATSGNIVKDGQRFLHTTGTDSTFLGSRAGNLNANTTNITAVGAFSLQNFLVGFSNTAVGTNAFANLGSGSNNVAIGASAGIQLTSGGSNIYIGHAGSSATENQTTRIGQAQSRAFIAGIRGVTTGSSNAIPVVIDSNGQLGTISSSGRYKFDVTDMANSSSPVLQLRPVTFRYNEYGPDSSVQYGLIAEEVAKVAPELVVFNASGQPETVMYHFLTPMLLNEVQKQQRVIAELQEKMARIEALLASEPVRGR